LAARTGANAGVAHVLVRALFELGLLDREGDRYRATPLLGGFDVGEIDWDGLLRFDFGRCWREGHETARLEGWVQQLARSIAGSDAQLHGYLVAPFVVGAALGLSDRPLDEAGFARAASALGPREAALLAAILRQAGVASV